MLARKIKKAIIKYICFYKEDFMKHTCKQGFTLTELMTVVIILAILMGIAGGSYRKAAERSNFTEGLVAAHSLMEAVERYHQDHPDVMRPSIPNLDLTLQHQTSCSGSSCYWLKTKYFDVTLNSTKDANDKYDVNVTAVRKGGMYTITVYPESYGKNRLAPDTCQEMNKKTAFCVSVGYTNCNAGGVCSKPTGN